MKLGLILSALGPCVLALSGSSAAPLLSADPFEPSALSAALCRSSNLGSVLIRELGIARAQADPASLNQPIPLYSDLTASDFEVGTANSEAEAYFRQGLMLAYGFNHSGAVRSFREAQRRDPACALCWWGEALALGPNINAPMDERDRPTALAALERALALSPSASPKAKALIQALSLRYSHAPDTDRAALDLAYAEAMTRVAARFPEDNDIAALTAEALMDTSPWNYWEADGKTPFAPIATAIDMIETVITRAPQHPQAAHLYIHLLEASDPARAEAAADRLSASSPPSAGHLVHMPGHIYMRRGRQADSIRLNLAAARADEAFIHATNDQSMVRYGYYPHNIHFIVSSAQLAGDLNTAQREAQRLRTVLNPETSAKIAWVQTIDAAPYLVLVQAAQSADILRAPAPDPRLPYPTAIRHYARAIAFALQHQPAAFEREIAAMNAIKNSTRLDDMIDQGVPAKDLLQLAELTARARLASAQGQHHQAIALYEQALIIEATIPYQEPAYWPWPVRQSLGAAQLQAGLPAEAAETFRQALLQTPNNGWVLYGLAQAQSALGQRQEAASTRAAFRQAWLGNPRWLRVDRL